MENKIPAKYAGSSTAGGSATSAVKLDTATAGSATNPCYFSGGKPVKCTYSLAKSVPSTALFTDTKYYFTTKTVYGKVKGFAASVDIPITAPSGYSFVSWINASSSGWICSVSLDTVFSNSTFARVWNTAPGDPSGGEVCATALYVKST